MKISISYPPIVNEYGQVAMVSQNRNVQYFKSPTYLLPVIYAQAATMLKDNGYNVIWDDGNSEQISYESWFKRVILNKPDYIVFETTTPVMKFMWKVINDIKSQIPNSKIILTGYHVMRMPYESFSNSLVDVIIKSNHVDFTLLRLMNELKENNNSFKKLKTQGLVIKNENGEIYDTGNFRLTESITKSSLINRDLVKWKNYAYENGNFLRTPGTYATSVIRDCMFGKCTFCRYNGPELTFSKMDIDKSVSEYEILINKYKVKEIFDDSGVWYRGSDAIKFAKKIIDKGLHNKGCYFGINTRFEYMDEETVKWLSRANFRFVLIGLESGDDFTLEKLNKGYSTKNVLENLKIMTKYGLHPHLTIMVGYYWETQEMLDKTISLVKKIMYSGLARTLQVTLCTPLDYTPYHVECIDKKIILTQNYDDHDMSKLIVKTPIPHVNYYKAVKELYSIAFNYRFIFRQILFLFKFKKRDWEFLFVYGFRALRRVRQHIFNLTREI